MGEIINFFNIKNGLLIDSVAWIIFGLLWMGMPNTLLSTNFGVKNYDWVTVHMTQAFGLFCLFSGVVSWTIYQERNQRLGRKILEMKLITEIILLILMIYANKVILESHLKFGMFGLTLCILVNIIVLVNSKN